MRGDELLDILEHIDPALIEQADRKPKATWLRWTAAAACLAVVIGLCALFLPGEEPEPGRTALPLMDLLNHRVYSQPLTGVQVKGSPTSGNAGTHSGTQGVRPTFEFRCHLMAEGRVAEVLPDVYTEALSQREYRILRVRTMDDILGQNFPREFYLRIDAGMSTELGQYDSLIFSLKQVGIDDFLMCNQTTNTLEAFTLLFELNSSWYSPDNTALAYTDGELDASLWELPGWSLGSYAEKKILEDGYNGRAPAKAGSSPADTKAEIRRRAAKNQKLQTLRVESQADFPENSVFEYVKPFVNGVFDQEYDSTNRVTYTRLINGLRTNEQILVQGKTVIRSGEVFTQEDMATLPDVAALVSAVDLEHMQNPHAQYYEGKDVRLWRKGATGMYAKVDGQVYGIVKVTWVFLQNGVYGTTVDYYDAIYYLMEPEGNIRTAAYEELYKLLRGDDFLVKPTTLAELNKYAR